MTVHDGKVTRVTLVRHGQSDFNADKRFQGSLDEPQLTTRGWKTAVACGNHLNKSHYDLIVCSPLRRARQTVEGILSTYGSDRIAPPVIYDARLREVHLPGWEGLSMQLIKDKYPTEYRTWRESPDRLALQAQLSSAQCNNSEFSPLGDMKERACTFWEDLLLHRRGKTVLIVGHGAAISVMLAVALKLPLEHVHRVQQSNGGVSCLEFIADRTMPARALTINRTQHLGETLPKMKEGRTGVRILLSGEGWTSSIPWDYPVPGACVDIIQGEGSAQIISGVLECADDQIRTIAWVQPAGRVESEMFSTLRLEHWQSHGLAMEGGGLTVLHYPLRGCKPIVQAMNIHPIPAKQSEK